MIEAVNPVASNVPAMPVPKSVPAAPKVTAVNSLGVHRVNLSAFLQKQDGRFVGLTFTKVDGQPRKLNGRLGVRKHLKTEDTVATTAADSLPYVVIYDMRARGYRAVNLATLTEIRAQRQKMHVIG